MIEAENNLLGHLFKYDFDSLDGIVKTNAVDKLRVYSNDKNKEYFQSVKDTGLSVIDYLFLSHQQGYRGITELAKEVGIGPNTLGDIFDSLSLPRLTSGEIKYLKGINSNLATILEIYEETGGNVAEIYRRTGHNKKGLFDKLKELGLEPMSHGGARLRPDGNRWGRMGLLSPQEGQIIINNYSQLLFTYEQPIKPNERRRIINKVARLTGHAAQTVDRYVLYWEYHGNLDGPTTPIEQDEVQILRVLEETGNKAETARRTLRSSPSIVKILELQEEK